MSRKGRKRKFDVQRKPSGKVRDQVITGNPVVLAKRAMVAKDVRADADNPLSVLFYRGSISQDQHDAGFDLAALYWRLHGKPFAKGAGGVHGLDAVDGARALRDERTFTQAMRALDRLGRNTRSIVVDCCAHLTWTPKASHVERLREGLQALYDLPRPKISDREKEAARAEMAA